MIDTRKMTPRVLSYKSRDFQLLSKLLDLVANSIKLDIEYFPNLVDPGKCKANWLEVLGSLVGYKYDESLSTEQNRFIISNYKSLLRVRGSKQGIELAVSMYLKLIGRDDTRFKVTIPSKTSDDMVEGTIYIDDELLDVSLLPLLSKLLEWVRPVGVNYVIRKSTTQGFKSLASISQSTYSYQMKYPFDLTVATPSVGRGDDRSIAQTGKGLTNDELEFNVDNPDNVVGHSIVDKGDE